MESSINNAQACYWTELRFTHIKTLLSHSMAIAFQWKAMLEEKIVIVKVRESQPSFSQIECNLTCHSVYVSFHVKRLRASGIFLQQNACTIDWKIKVNSTGTLGIIEYSCKATSISCLKLGYSFICLNVHQSVYYLLPYFSAITQ